MQTRANFAVLRDAAAASLALVPAAALRRGIVAAVSGGADSSALLLVLADLAREGRIEGPLRVAHVDHAVRPESGRDAEAVRALAARLGVPCEVRRLDGRGKRSEAALRDARYEALTAVAREHAAGVVATAHHADDQVETVLFRIGRGTRLRGLAGIPGVRPLADELLLARPLLAARRADLVACCRAHGVAPRHDATNDDLRQARAAIRHRVLPALRAALGAQFDDQVLALARVARRVADAREGAARAFLAAAARHGQEHVHVTLGGREPPRVVADALALLHAELRGGPALPSWLDRALALCAAPTGRTLNGRGATVAVTRTRVGLALCATGRSRPAVAPPCAPLHTGAPAAGANPSRPAGP